MVEPFFIPLRHLSQHFLRKTWDVYNFLRAFAELSVIAVETGDRYFPHCSQVVNDFLDASLLEKSTLEEQKLKVDMQEALPKDVAYHRRSGLPSSWSAFYKYMAESNQSAFYKYLAESNRSGRYLTFGKLKELSELDWYL
ncbi:BTB/POZ domain and ankyrin repeat-containing protein NPR3-like [Citrus clementina]|uniref:BTB/POZ domain and ankyrin repeat-containing protein NPR3-like n=1 Tax=Citrus clementina TaxID=85681 RepID=UPI000CED762B|nr:BTB/POZ domain and ankyrin repeat-containing protein NPR3-like [Citrus x clementina]